MGKLSKILLNSIFFTAAVAQDDTTFQVTSCNADVSFLGLRRLHSVETSVTLPQTSAALTSATLTHRPFSTATLHIASMPSTLRSKCGTWFFFCLSSFDPLSTWLFVFRITLQRWHLKSRKIFLRTIWMVKRAISSYLTGFIRGPSSKTISYLLLIQPMMVSFKYLDEIPFFFWTTEKVT